MTCSNRLSERKRRRSCALARPKNLASECNSWNRVTPEINHPLHELVRVQPLSAKIARSRCSRLINT